MAYWTFIWACRACEVAFKNAKPTQKARHRPRLPQGAITELAIWCSWACLSGRIKCLNGRVGRLVRRIEARSLPQKRGPARHKQALERKLSLGDINYWRIYIGWACLSGGTNVESPDYHKVIRKCGRYWAFMGVLGVWVGVLTTPRWVKQARTQTHFWRKLSQCAINLLAFLDS